MQATTVPATAAVQDWGDSIRASLTSGFAVFFSSLPRILAFLVILLIGWFVASLLARGVGALLRAVKFNQLSERAGFTEFVRSMGVERDASGVVALVVKWFLRVFTLVVAFDALGLPAVSQVLQQLLLWLPNLVVALVVLVIGGLAASALSRLVRGATTEAGFTNPDVLATVARVAVWAFAIVVAVNQLGIATALVNTLLIGVVGAAALASGLAFGLGGREKAAEWIQQWSASGGEAAPKLRQAADRAKQQTRQPSRTWDVGVTPTPMRADQPPGEGGPRGE
jgi:hypothetical protein